MSKVVCIPDASALEHLEGIIVGGKDVRDWLIDELEVLPTEKICEEFEEGCKIRGVTDPLIKKFRKQAESVEIEDEIREALKNLAGRSLSRFQDGELTGVRLGLRLLKVDEFGIRHIIFLSDDLEAFERSEGGKQLLQKIPAFCFWTSADLILYLVFRLGGKGGVGMRRQDFFNALEIAIQRMCPALAMTSGTTMKATARINWEARKQRYLAWFDQVYEGSFIGW